MATTACVVTGDVVGSRSVDDREALRERLERGVAAANDALADDLLAPFAILKGVDEVAGVLASAAGVDRALQALGEAIHPTEMRFAVVRGTVDVGADSGVVSQMDGPAFHRADELLETLATEDRYVGLDLGAEADSITVDLLEGLCDLLCAWKGEWTERQADLVGKYRQAESMTAVADAEGVTVQVVSKTLGRAGAETVLRTERRIGRGFDSLAA
ncbi:SatD family protein [Halobacteriales archaeon Cl-PHB]